MNDKPSIDQRDQVVLGPKTNIAGDIQGSVFSGQFQRDFIYNASAKHRLPLQKPPRAQHFTGREEELASLLNDLQPGRVVTICGPGGMGKTALAAEAIWSLAPGNSPPERFPDGIIFHTFYHKPQAALALEAIVRAYGEEPHAGGPLEAAKRALAGRQALIVLDGTETCDDLEIVLSVTASCGVLITTRRHSDAPTDFSDLPPLPPDKAVQLLQALGGALASDEKICQSICRLLGGLPLAIFLVGRYMAHRRQLASDYLTWLEKTPLAALNLGERQHQSIPLLMERSLEQVDDNARAALGVIGILAPEPFESEFISVALGVHQLEVNHRLGDLVDYGLLIRPDASYQVTHVLIHDYAREKLDLKRDALVRLAEFYITLIRELSKSGPSGFAFIDPHRLHIMAVQSACLDEEEWKVVQDLTWVTDTYLDMQGYWIERANMVKKGLSAARKNNSLYSEGNFLNILGLTYSNLGMFHEAITIYDQALTINNSLDDSWGRVKTIGNKANVLRNLGDFQESLRLYEMALTIARKIGDLHGEGANLSNLGLTYTALNKHHLAIEPYEQALEIAREVGNKRGESNALGNLATVYADLGDTHKAIEFYNQQLLIADKIGYIRGKCNALCNLGVTYADLGNACKAIRFYEKVLAITNRIGDKRGEASALWNMSLALYGLGKSKQAIDRAESALRIFEQIKSPYAERVRNELAKWWSAAKYER
jgi:tetratricopeptide (TPR) repeat protein